MFNMKKIAGFLWLMSMVAVTRLHAQNANFNFSAGAAVVSGWTNVAGDPAIGTVTATAPSGITISSVSPANWAPYEGNSAFNGFGTPGGTFFPAAVMINDWFQYSGVGGTLAAYNSAVPQLIIGGLNPDSVYTIKMSSSNSTGFNTNPTRYTVIGAVTVGFQDVNTVNNTASGATFNNVAPTLGGQVSIYVNTISGTESAGIQRRPPPLYGSPALPITISLPKMAM
jgi:hypothetical protein